MIFINKIITWLFDLFFLPFSKIDPQWGLIALSVVTGVVMLAIFKATSNQEGIQKTKQRIKGLFFEIRLYQNDLKQSLRAQGSILRTNITYMKYSVFPMLVMIVPVIIILIQLNFRFSNRPLFPGDQVNVKVIAAQSLSSLDDITLKTSKGLKITAKALHIPSKGEIDWKIKATLLSNQTLTFQANGKKIIVSIPVTSNLMRVYPDIMKPNLLDAWLYSGAPFLKDDAFISQISISYPEKSTPILSLDMNWLISFLIISIIAGFAFKKPFGVEI